MGKLPLFSDCILKSNYGLILIIGYNINQRGSSILRGGKMLTAISCLAMAIYFEARGEPMVGQVAVAQVVMHRVADHRYPNTVCEVVKQGYYYTWNPEIPIRDKCQFSFWCDGKPETIKDKSAYAWAKEVARETMAGTLYDTTQGSTHYHAYYVQPSWSKKFTKTVRINDHIFYRWEIE